MLKTTSFLVTALLVVAFLAGCNDTIAPLPSPGDEPTLGEERSPPGEQGGDGGDGAVGGMDPVSEPPPDASGDGGPACDASRSRATSDATGQDLPCIEDCDCPAGTTCEGGGSDKHCTPLTESPQ